VNFTTLLLRNLFEVPGELSQISGGGDDEGENPSEADQPPQPE
jgi:hypothetical protein